MAFPFPPTSAADLSTNLCTKPGGSYRSHHKTLDKARHPQQEVKWALMTILILLNSCWRWVKPHLCCSLEELGGWFHCENLPVLPMKGILQMDSAMPSSVDQNQAEQKPSLPVLTVWCGQVGLVTIPFWRRLWLWDLGRVFGLSKNHRVISSWDLCL